jgi:hypothetical protein
MRMTLVAFLFGGQAFDASQNRASRGFIRPDFWGRWSGAAIGIGITIAVAVILSLVGIWKYTLKPVWKWGCDMASLLREVPFPK